MHVVGRFWADGRTVETWRCLQCGHEQTVERAEEMPEWVQRNR